MSLFAKGGESLSLVSFESNELFSHFGCVGGRVFHKPMTSFGGQSSGFKMSETEGEKEESREKKTSENIGANPQNAEMSGNRKEKGGRKTGERGQRRGKQGKKDRGKKGGKDREEGERWKSGVGEGSDLSLFPRHPPSQTLRSLCCNSNRATGVPVPHGTAE